MGNLTIWLFDLVFSPLQAKPLKIKEWCILLLYFLLAQLTSGRSRCPGIFVDTLPQVLVKGMILSSTFSQPIKRKKITHLCGSAWNDFLSSHLTVLVSVVLGIKFGLATASSDCVITPGAASKPDRPISGASNFCNFQSPPSQ